MAHVFISYKREEIAFASEIEKQLRAANFEVWKDDQIEGGDDWLNSIEQEIRNSYVVVVVITPEALKPDSWVIYEWIFARGADKTVVPVKLKKVDEKNMPYRLHDRNLIDFSSSYDWDKLIKRLRDLQNEQPADTDVSPTLPPLIAQAIAGVESLDRNVRNKVFENLKDSNHEDVIKLLFQFLDNHFGDVRTNAALLLSDKTNYSDNRVIPRLLEGLTQKDNLPKLKSDYAIALQKFGRDAVPGLIGALSSEVEDTRIKSAWSLGEIGDERAIHNLIQSLADNNFSVVRASVKALGNIKHPDAIPALASILAQNSRKKMEGLQEVLGTTIGKWIERVDEWNYKHLCNDAAEALTRIGTPAALAAVEQWQREQGGGQA